MPEMKSLGYIWDTNLEIYSKNFGLASLLVLFLSLPLIILLFFSPYNLFKPDFTHGHWVFFVIEFVASVLVGALLSLALTYSIYQRSKNKKVKFIDALRFAFPRFWKTFGTSMLMVLMLIGLFLLLIVPGLIFALYWMFMIQVVVIKGLYGKKALDYSKSVVKHRWWKVLGYSIVFALIPITLTMVTMFFMTAYLPSNIGYCIYYVVSILANVFISTSQTVMFLELDKSKEK